MSAGDAARIRAAPAVRVLDGGSDNVNRVVETRDFGLVIDRQRKPRRDSPLTASPPALPQPHFEHDILRNLNSAGASFVQGIHYADATGLILEYVDGETFTDAQWNTDAGLRGEYARRLPKVMAELTALSAAVTPTAIRRDERGAWPARLASTAQYGHLLRHRTILAWNRVSKTWVTRLLAEFGDTEHVAKRLAGFELTGNRPVTFLHNDLHPWNTIRRPFTLLDWTTGGSGDPLWEVTMVERVFRPGSEREQFMANAQAELPRAVFDGFERDSAQYDVLYRERSRTMSAGFIAEQATQALHAAARNDTPEARREAVRPYVEEIHLLSGSFSGRPLERSLDETADMVARHVDRQLGLHTAGHSGTSRRASRTNAAEVGSAGREADTRQTAKPALPAHMSATTNENSAANLSATPASSGLGAVNAKLPTALPSTTAAVNTGPVRTPTRAQMNQLNAHPARRRSLQRGHE